MTALSGSMTLAVVTLGVPSTWIYLLGGLIVALVAGAATFLAARLLNSGRIDTSAAVDLWTESRSIREFAERRADQLSAEVAQLRGENELLHRAADETRQQAHACQQEVLAMRTKLATAQRQIRALRRRVDAK